MVLLAQGVCFAAEPNRLTPAEIADGWILLFDGETTFGWQATSRADWKVKDGLIRVSAGEPGWLQTTSPFADFRLSVEFRKQPKTNSGIFVRSTATPKNPTADCYEVNLASAAVSKFPTGSLVDRKRAADVPDDDQWHRLEISAEGATFVVRVDDRQVLDYHDPRPLARGVIGLQFREGPVEFRSIKLKPLGLKTIFNGRDLAGWREFAGKAAKFSVTPRGELAVRGGDGQLETRELWDDFVFQGEIYVDGRHLNSGIFFRSLPGELWQGYESQIHNGYTGGDRTRPIDGGTGGFYRRQNARRVVADDFTWFSKTLVVAGNHMAAWVNGYQVSDWMDTRAANANPRRGSRLERGSIIIQAHDATTNLRFRKLRIAALPR